MLTDEMRSPLRSLIAIHSHRLEVGYGSNATEPFDADADKCLLLPQERPNRGQVAKHEKGHEPTSHNRQIGSEFQC
jgi:hypothetical protein